MHNKIKTSFNRAAKSYDQAATVQMLIADDLFSYTQAHTTQPQHILELGAGTGYLSHKLEQQYINSQLLISDCAECMLEVSQQQSQSQHIICSSEQLPITSDTQDLVISSLMLQWCDYAKVFDEAYRVLKGNGELIFTTLGPNTLQSLSLCYQYAHKIDHTNRLPKLETLEKSLSKLNLSKLHCFKQSYSIPYASHYHLLYAISKIGSTYNQVRNKNGLTTSRFFERLDQAYQQLFPGHTHIMANYEVFFIHGQK